MEFLFPVSGITANPILLFFATFGLSFFSSMAGVSGAFLLLPFQMSVLGYTAPGVSATNHLYNIVAIPSGVWRYWKEGRLVGPIVRCICVGTLPGVILGTLIRVKLLPDARLFKLFVGLVLLFIGYRMLQGIRKNSGVDQNAPVTDIIFLQKGWFAAKFVYQDTRHVISPVPVITWSTGIGIIGGIYGIGGGAMLVPILVSLYGLPIHVLAGAALLGTFVASIVGVATFVILDLLNPAQNLSPDWLLGLCFGLGGLCGMYLGALTQKRVTDKWLRIGLLCVILLTSTRYILGFFLL